MSNRYKTNTMKSNDTVYFVFGSNLAGRHGKGAAFDACQYWGAEYGKGEGFQGSSYALPTKDENLKPLSKDQIKENYITFMGLASNMRFSIFLLTPCGCGLAGLDRVEMLRWLYKEVNIPYNVVLTKEWFDNG